MPEHTHSKPQGNSPSRMTVQLPPSLISSMTSWRFSSEAILSVTSVGKVNCSASPASLDAVRRHCEYSLLPQAQTREGPSGLLLQTKEVSPPAATQKTGAMPIVLFCVDFTTTARKAPSHEGDKYDDIGVLAPPVRRPSCPSVFTVGSSRPEVEQQRQRRDSKGMG